MQEMPLSTIILLTVTAIIFIADVVLCLCIGLVLPAQLKHSDTATLNKSIEELVEKCKCKVTTQRPENDSFLTTNSEKPIYTRTTINAHTTIKKPVKSTTAITINGSTTVEIAARADVVLQDDDAEVAEQKSFIVSIHSKNISNSFLCTGVAISENWIVTGYICVRRFTSREKLIIKQGSNNKQLGRLLHYVHTKSSPINGLIALQTSEPLNVIPIQIIRNYSNYRTQPLKTIGWEIDDTSDELQTKFFTLKPNCTNDIALLSSDDCRDMPSGKLIIINNTLFGIETCIRGNIHSFTDFDSAVVQNWFNHLLEMPKVQKYETHLRRNVLYCMDENGIIEQKQIETAPEMKATTESIATTNGIRHKDLDEVLRKPNTRIFRFNEHKTKMQSYVNTTPNFVTVDDSETSKYTLRKHRYKTATTPKLSSTVIMETEPPIEPIDDVLYNIWKQSRNASRANITYEEFKKSFKNFLTEL